MSCNMIKYFLLAFIFSTSLSASNAQSANSSQPEVTIPQGTLRGKIINTRKGRNVSAFLGIPYAEPPINDLRFRNPVAAGGWNGIRNASVDAKICPQTGIFDSSGVTILGDEDCLYINVYTPQVPQSSNASLLPVMVWIHGGEFAWWSSVSTLYGPEYLLDEDVILVAMNYRLGALGFLSTGDEEAYGNYGLKDMVLALRWVQDNVVYFGGDRNKVTIFGESAGAAAVDLLALSNSTIGLFHRYITESGSARSLWAHRPRAAYARRAFQLAEYVGCPNDTTASMVNCLRSTSVTNILSAQSRFKEWGEFPVGIWTPTDEPDTEGAFLTDSPTNLLVAGKSRDLPWITGVTKDEGLLVMTELAGEEGMLEDVFENFDTVIPILLGLSYQSAETSATWTNAIRSFYFNDDLTANNTMRSQKLMELITDIYFNFGMHSALQLRHTSAVSPQYVYVFNYRGTYSFPDTMGGQSVYDGVSHCDDLIYLFPSDDLYLTLNKTMNDNDNKMIDIMAKFWTSFAANGVPSIASLNLNTTWDSYSSTDNYIQIGNGSDTSVDMQYSFVTERMEFWARLTNNTETPTVAPDVSGSVLLTPSFLSMFLAVFSVHFFSKATVDIFE